MIELRTLGGLSVQSGDQQRMLARRMPLALLTILAVAAPHGVARDKLLALLWPDLDLEHARNALNQTLFGIRRDLGRPDVVVGRSDLRLNLDVVSCDLVRFVNAATAGDPAAAVAQYTGPFLDGFFLSDAPEFERWVEETRGRLARRAVGLLRDLATAAERAGDLHGAADLRWRVTEIDPLDSAAALELVRTLASAGERTRAVVFARRHEALLREEIGSGVDPAMSELVVRLLADGRALPSTDDTDASTPSGGGGQPPAPLRAEGDPMVAHPRPPTPLTRRPAVRAVAAAITLVVIVTAAFSRNRWQRPPAADRTSAEQATVAVLPFVVRGPAEANYLRAGLVELISRGLDGAGDVRPVDPRLVLRTVTDSSDVDDEARGYALAQDLGAQQFVLGNVSVTAGALRLSASLYERSPVLRRVVAASVDGRPDELLGLVDRLTTQLLAARTSRYRTGATDIASLSTRSLPALKAFLTGQAYRQSARYAEALEAFQDAVRLDSTFALAWYGLSNTADWASHGELVLPAAREAARYSGRLTEHDRLLTQAYLAWREDRVLAAERMYSLLVHSYPDDAESWYQLGELYFHHNSRRGRSFAEARKPFEEVRKVVPGDREALMHLIRIALRTGSRREVDSLTALALSEHPGLDEHEIRAIRAYALDDPAGKAAALRELSTASGVTLSVVAWRVSMYALDLIGADRILRLGTSPERPIALQAPARHARAFVLAGLGQLQEADQALQWLDHYGETSRGGLTTRATLVLGLPTPPPGPDIERLYSRLDSAARIDLAGADVNDSTFAFEAACFAGLAAAQAGQDGRALKWVDRLAGVRTPQGAADRARVCTGSIRARMDLRRGRVARALDILLSHRSDRVPEGTFDILDRFTIAEALFSLRRDEEAAQWFTAMAQRGFEELPFMAPSERRLGQLAERRGDRAAALSHYRRFTELWAHADPGLAAQVDSVRARLAFLDSSLARSLRGSPAGTATPGR